MPRMDFFELDPAARIRILSPTPMDRIGEPPSPLFLAFENANYITGQTIYSDVGEPPSGCYGADEGRLSTS